MATDSTSEFINRHTVEKAYRMSGKMQKLSSKGNDHQKAEAEVFAQRGMRAARSKDHRTLVALEQATEVLLKLSNEQYGQYRQRIDIPESHRVEPTVVQLWREAYKMADQGTPLENFMWIYGAAVKLAHGF